MPSASGSARLVDVRPLWAVPGGRIAIRGSGFPIDGARLPAVRLGSEEVRLVLGSPAELHVIVPAGLAGGSTPVRVDGVPGETAFVEIGSVVAADVHQVDSPAFDRRGNLYVTYSGTRGQQVPASLFRVRRDGVREPIPTGIANPTSLAFDAEDNLYVSSRFEGSVYRVAPGGAVDLYVGDLGVPCGLAFGPDGALYVGDRSGSILRVERDQSTTVVASLPSSVAAYHLAFGPDAHLYVTAPTLSTQDAVYRVDLDGHVSTITTEFGRPQGLAFDHQGSLYVAEALAGASGVYRLQLDRDPADVELVLAGAGLVGVAFDPAGGLVVASNDTVYRLDLRVRGPAQ